MGLEKSKLHSASCSMIVCRLTQRRVLVGRDQSLLHPKQIGHVLQVWRLVTCTQVRYAKLALFVVDCLRRDDG